MSLLPGYDARKLACPGDELPLERCEGQCDECGAEAEDGEALCNGCADYWRAVENRIDEEI